MFGDNYYFVDRTHINRTDIDGSPRGHNSFYGYANEPQSVGCMEASIIAQQLKWVLSRELRLVKMLGRWSSNNSCRDMAKDK
ncbi:MAG: hypothetical protein R3B93_08525 [Bacteroidia bacterium]